MDEKKCDRCGLTQNIVSFYRGNTGTTRRVCSPCRAKVYKDRYNFQKLKDYPDEYVECVTCGHVHPICRACVKCRIKADAKLRVQRLMQ